MPSVRRLRLNYSGAGIVGPAVSTFYFDAAVGTAVQAVTAVQLFMTSIRNDLSSTLGWQLETDIDTLDATSGVLTNVESAGTTANTGNNGFEILPPATQGRVNLLTGVIVANRQLRGRLYIPGFTEGVNTNGGPVAGTQTLVNSAATTLAGDANAQWVVWSRTHGVFSPITVPTMWTKWGSLRSRRD
jgi:hypothetical protein